MTSQTPTPSYWVHQSWRNRSALTPIINAAAASGYHGLGLMLSFDNVHQPGVYAAAMGAQAPFAADPGWRFGRPTIGQVPAASWLARQAPSVDQQWDKAIAEATRAQRSLGRVALLMTPSPEFHGAHGRTALRRMIDASRRAFRSRPDDDPPWFVRLTVRDEWLTDTRLRKDALNELTNLPEDVGVALHVRWSKRDVTTDASALGGLKAFAETLARDARPLLTLNSGLTGWLALGWGAEAFTAGLTQASWLDSTVPIKSRKDQPRPPEIKWFFDANLLQSFRDTDYWHLRGTAGYTVCACPFCAALATGAPWKPTAQQHALFALNELASEVSSSTGDARDAVETKLRAAQAYWAAIIPKAGLSPQPRPVHLTAWLQAL